MNQHYLEQFDEFCMEIRKMQEEVNDEVISLLASYDAEDMRLMDILNFTDEEKLLTMTEAVSLASLDPGAEGFMFASRAMFRSIAREDIETDEFESPIHDPQSHHCIMAVIAHGKDPENIQVEVRVMPFVMLDDGSPDFENIEHLPATDGITEQESFMISMYKSQLKTRHELDTMEAASPIEVLLHYLTERKEKLHNIFVNQSNKKAVATFNLEGEDFE